MTIARYARNEGRTATWADTFKAMGDATRLSILLRLVRKEHCVTDLAKALKQDAPTVSFHLTKLRYSGLVVNERRGQRVFYSVNPKLVKRARGAVVLNIDGCLVRFRKTK